MGSRPCIFIPGIMGSTLENVYPLEPESTWLGLATPFSLDRLALTPEGDADSLPTVLLRARVLFKDAYSGMIHGLRGRSDAPVYPFPYDWRLSTATNGQRLADFVRELLRRRLAGVAEDGKAGFDFVCHSMGGLVFRQLLKVWGAQAPLPVNRVVFVATPQLGSLEAVEAMVRGGVMLIPGLKALRKLARTFPGVYELLPRLKDAFVSQGQPLDLFDVNNWQSNVSEPSPRREDVEQGRLSAAKAALDGMPNPLEPALGLQGRVLVVYGDKQGSTLRRVPVLADGDGVKNWFDFEHGTRGGGDELVPVDSAALPGAPYVRIPFEAISYFNDVKVRLLNFHSFITELDEVQTVTARFLDGSEGKDLLPLNLRARAAQLLGTFE